MGWLLVVGAGFVAFVGIGVVLTMKVVMRVWRAMAMAMFGGVLRM